MGLLLELITQGIGYIVISARDSIYPLSMQTLLVKDQKVGWFCINTQPKHEHILAAHLRIMVGVEVFLPRVRFKRAVRERATWVTEALFPGYLFAHFNWETSMRRVQYTAGTRSIVHFGNSFPTISEKIIDELRQILGTKELHTIPEDLSPGDMVRISEGTLRGLSAVVSRILPSQQRVAVLMELLGQQTTVELTASSMVKEDQNRATLFRTLTDY